MQCNTIQYNTIANNVTDAFTHRKKVTIIVRLTPYVMYVCATAPLYWLAADMAPCRKLPGADFSQSPQVRQNDAHGTPSELFMHAHSLTVR